MQSQPQKPAIQKRGQCYERLTGKKPCQDQTAEHGEHQNDPVSLGTAFPGADRKPAGADPADHHQHRGRADPAGGRAGTGKDRGRGAGSRPQAHQH